MKVLLLGKSGMLGSYFLKLLSGTEDFEMYAFKKDGLDITNLEALKDTFERISPDFVINCAAYTAVDDCEKNHELAFRVNADAPGEIAKLCKQENAVLFHFSTDYVFDGNKKEGYREDDDPSPVNVYGESKLEGEKRIADNMSQYYIIRTSWLFGENGKNFVNTMIELSKDKEELNVVSDQIGSPTYAKDLCDAVIKHFLSPHVAEKLPFGIYHITNSGTVSWYGFAGKIFEILGIDIKVNKINSEKFPRPAERPHYSILLDTKINDKMRPWQEALEVYLKLNF